MHQADVRHVQVAHARCVERGRPPPKAGHPQGGRPPPVVRDIRTVYHMVKTCTCKFNCDMYKFIHAVGRREERRRPLTLPSRLHDVPRCTHIYIYLFIYTQGVEGGRETANDDSKSAPRRSKTIPSRLQDVP